jgi:predicted metal-dependent phosphoesterase TrpH
MTADLHSHTHYSDGTLSPGEMVELAKARSLAIIAITDHDTMDGVGEGLDAGKQLGVRVIPGVELTAQFHSDELHILGYFPDDGRWREPALQEKLAAFKQVRHERIQKMVARLQAAGVAIDFESVRKLAGKGAMGRPHVARALLEAGQIRSFDEAFNRFLTRGKPAWVDKPRITSEEAVSLIHAAGGLAVLAHPGLMRSNAIPQDLVSQGLDGIEVYHTKHDARLVGRYLEWTVKNSLLATGGSDCHGNAVHEPILGNVRLDGALLEEFLRRLG